MEEVTPVAFLRHERSWVGEVMEVREKKDCVHKKQHMPA